VDIKIEWQQPIQLTKHKKPLVDEDDLPEKIAAKAGVYFFSRRFGVKFEPFYIGETLNIRSRLKSHLNSKKIAFVLLDIDPKSQVRLESEVARYPRIMLTKDVVDDAMASNLKHYFIEQIRQADDGPHFLNIFYYLNIQLAIIKARKEDTPVSDKVLLHFKTLREMIQRRFDESVDNPKHFEKVQWFANYWNISFPKEQEGFEMINGAGLFKMRFLDT
jgi:hypothetical protein